MMRAHLSGVRCFHMPSATVRCLDVSTAAARWTFERPHLLLVLTLERLHLLRVLTL